MKVKVADRNGRSVEKTVSAFVTGVGLVDGTLYVVGGAGRDLVFIDQFQRSFSNTASVVSTLGQNFITA